MIMTTNTRKFMRQMLNIMAVAFIAVVFTACGGGSAKDEKGELGDKKVKLEKLKKEQETINRQVSDLEKEIEILDPSAAAKPKLVAVTTIGTDTFSHYIDLQGKIDAQNVAYVSPRGQGGTIKAIYVRQGQNVRKGQVILRLDDVLARQGLASAQQRIAGIEAQAKLAQSIYERRQNLWKQNIGSEVEVLNAKTNAEAAQSQLNAAREEVKLAQEQVNLSNVTAEISGTVDQLNVRVGEFFSPQSAANPSSGISIVNTGELKILVQVPENYLGRVTEGSTLEVTLPESNKSFTTRISVAGKLIDPNTRSFYIEGKLPAGTKDLRPNQIAMVRIKDYATPNAITIPVNTLQNDEKGKYVMVAVKEKDKLIARKKQVVVGELYGDKLEVRSGLATGDVLITDGFQNLYDGQLITTEVK
jgi:membrane fusion protein, multidrug efflux system